MRVRARWQPMLLAAALAVSLCACDPHYNWRDYRSQEVSQEGSQVAAYAVLFPAKPSTHAREVRLGDGPGAITVRMTMTAAEVDGVLFAVGSAMLPDAAQAPAALQAMHTALARNLGATVTSHAVATSGAQTTVSVEAQGTRNGEPALLVGRFIARERRVYQVVVMGPARTMPREQVDTFLASFKPI